jgi:hypothetical protein
MRHHDGETPQGHSHDKQLQGVTLEAVLEKRRLDQALNAKEFAVCAGVSYSTARGWFHLPGFPVFHGVVFWTDFVKWRAEHLGDNHVESSDSGSGKTGTSSTLPPRATQILLDS